MSIGVALVIGDGDTLSPDQEESLAGAGISVSRADDVPPLALQNASEFDIVLADLPEGDHEGSKRVERLHSLAIRFPLILLADDENLSNAYAIAGESAFDCLPHSVTGAWLTHKVHQALQKHRAAQAGAAASVLGGVKQSAVLIGGGAVIDRLRRQIDEAARSNMPIMVHGETGTGKDVVARLIHEASKDTRPGAFVKVNCPSFPEALLEEELFGYPAANGRQAKPGRLELAARGTLLLDEVSEMGSAAQARLLDVLEPDQDASAWNLRLISTTGLTHDQLYSDDSFRRDLYFRLNGYTIELPPLRDRPEDISLLVDFFLAKYASLKSDRKLEVPPHALARMSQYGWPGNVRELEVAVKRFAVNGDEAALTSTFVKTEESSEDDGAGDRYHESERRVILSALAETRWNRRKAAKILGISYNTLRRRIERYHLDVQGTN